MTKIIDPKSIVRRPSAWLAALAALFLALAATGPAPAGADEQTEKKPPLTGSFRGLVEKKKVILDVDFNQTVIEDAELIFKTLAPAERPFTVTPPIDGLKARWVSPNQLRLETGLGERDWELLLVKGPLTVTWDRKLRSAAGQPLTKVGQTVFGDTYKRTNVTDTTTDQRGQLANAIQLPPPQVWINIGRAGNDATFTFSFNRPMVARDQVGQEMDQSAAPFDLEPPLPLKGSWTSDRTVSFRTNFTQEEFWAKVTDQVFSLKWKPDFKTLTGDAAPTLATNVDPRYARPFYIERFEAAALDQTAMNLEGEASLDLMFNKPVELADVRARIKAELFVPDESAQNKTVNGKFVPLPLEVVSVGGPGDAAGLIARLKVKSGPDRIIRVLVGGLKSADGRGLIEKREIQYTTQSFFTIRNTGTEVEDDYPWRPYFSIELRDAVKPDDLEKYIKLDPPRPFQVSPYGREGNSIQIFAAFSATEPTTVTLLRGLPSEKGVLDEDLSYEVTLSDKARPKLIFTGRGRYLTPKKPLLVKVAGRNIERVRLQAWRIYENNLPPLLNLQDYADYVKSGLTLQFSKNILDKETEVKSTPGEVFERLLDLKNLLGNDGGAYLLKISPVIKSAEESDAESDEYYHYRDYYENIERYLPVMISDLGVSTRAWPNRAAVWVNSLATAKPVAEAQVRFYDRANQVLGAGKTDRDGLASVEIDPSQAVFVTVEKDGDLNYVTFGPEARRGGGYDSEDEESEYYDDEYEAYYYRDGGGARGPRWHGEGNGYVNVEAPAGPNRRDFLSRGYEAFVFMPRDMFKPGEMLKVKAIVRNRDILPPAESFPVIWRVNDPDGRPLTQGRADLSPEGGLDFATEIPFSARTGSWQVQLSLPGSPAVIGSAGFTVEDFVPPRLALELTPAQKIFYGENPEISLAAQAKYLFGAPGTDLKWELDALASSAAFNPKGWEGFDFTSPPSDFQDTRQRRAATGQLDENGRTDILYQPNFATDRLPNRLSLEFTLSVQEDGGRWNATRGAADYFPRPVILGSRGPSAPAVDQPFTYEVAAVDPEGKAAALAGVNVQVSQVVTRYYNTYRYGRHYRQSAEELKPQMDAEVKLADGRGAFEFRPAAAGVYEVNIADPVSGLAVTRRLEVYGLEGPTEEAAKSRVEIQFDKPGYRPGDTAKVKLVAPFTGRLWVTVDLDGPVYSKAYDMNSKEMEIKVPVSEAIRSNAWLTATVVRPLSETASGGWRAIGVASLEMDRERNRLKISADMPDRIKPSSRAKLTVTLADEAGRPVAGEVAVALVDEGVLSLTNFKTPDPWRMFTAGRNFLTRFYDLYEQLLPLETVALPFLTPGGGDGLGRAGLFSPFKRNQEVLSIFLAKVPVDQSGRAEVELNIPEYSGQGRLMVVGSSRDRFGNTARQIRVNRDLTAEVTLPLALAPGDTFEIPVRVFLSDQAPAKAGSGARLKFTTEGPIKLSEENEAAFDLAPGQGQTRVFQAEAVPAAWGADRAGLGRLIVESRDGAGEAFTQTLEVAVRPPFPRVSFTRSALASSDREQIEIPTAGYLAGTVEASLTIARSPAVEAVRAVRYLKDYPYGCLEQTVSKAWPFLAAEDFLGGLEKADETVDPAYGLHSAIRRLGTMRTIGGGFAPWPGGDESYEWGSVYATHFLTLARPRAELPPGLLENAVKWLRAYMASGYSERDGRDAAYILATKAYACYVLALNGDYRAGWVNALRDRYEGLSPSARLFLAGAVAQHEGNPRALIELDKEEAADDEENDSLSQRYSTLESDSRNLSLKLLLWSEVDPLSKRARDLAQEVIKDGANNRWRSTQENGMAVLALGGYLSKSGTGKPYEAVLRGADGRELLKVNQNKLATAGPKVLAPAVGRPLTLEIKGEGRPYYSLTVGAVPETAPEPKAADLALSRTWILGDPDNEKEAVKHPLSTAGETANILTVAKGDRVTVELVVSADRPLSNLVLVDLLPGGFEIENPRLVPPPKAGEGDDEDEDDGPPPPASHLELREDRLVVIEPWLAPGEIRYRYTLRAITPGDYVLPPTVAEGMYEPDRQAILATGRVRVTK